MNDEMERPEGCEQDASEDRSHLRKPLFVSQLEARVAKVAPIPPVGLAVAKLAAIVPLVMMSTGKETPVVSAWPWTVLALFLVYLALDYLSDVLTCAKGVEREFGHVIDRASDYPIIFTLAYLCSDELPYYLPYLKCAVDVLLLVLYALGKGSARNRLRNGVNYAALAGMLFVWQGWGSTLFTTELVSYLVVASILFSAVVALYNLRVLQKRFIADTLSGANLMCGVFSMVFAYRGRFEVSLLFLMLGAAFDGFDGAAARRWGGTRWGVYSDDVADGVNYGIAPGVALFFALQGIEGVVLGFFYSAFTISRLVFFTLNKDESDPNVFCGVPSTLGGLITLCSLILFPEYPALIGMMVGVACILMVSFDTTYRHLGRALAKHKRAFFGMPFLIIILIAGLKFFGVNAPVALILAASIGYSMKPTASHLYRLMVTTDEEPA